MLIASLQTPNEMHAFLSKHKEMAHMCNKLACSSFRTDIDVRKLIRLHSGLHGVGSDLHRIRLD